jgi:hypothetical protein
MNLTVGPLPPAVYWRRRALVLGALLVIVVLLVSMCTAGSSSKRHGATSPTGNTVPLPSGSQSLLTPIIGDGSEGPSGGSGGSGSGGSGSGDGSTLSGDGSGNQPVSQPTATPCTDSQLSVTAAVQPLSVGYYLTLKVRNISAEACSADVGAIPQEIHVVNSANQVVFSSDFCQSASAAPDVRNFGPNIESTFRSYWDGRKWTVGCVRGAAVPPGSYQVVAKLGTRVSAPAPLTVGGTNIAGK